MEQNPLHSTDLSYGIPGAFSEVLDEILEEKEQEASEEDLPDDNYDIY